MYIYMEWTSVEDALLPFMIFATSVQRDIVHWYLLLCVIHGVTCIYSDSDSTIMLQHIVQNIATKENNPFSASSVVSQVMKG